MLNALRRAILLVVAATFVTASHGSARAAAADGRTPFGAGRAFVHYPRYHAYHLDDVVIHVDLDEAHGALTGDVTNTVTALHDGTRWIDFDSDGLRYSWVGLAGGQTLRYQLFGQTLRTFLPQPARAGAKLSIETRYAANPLIGMYFFLPDKAYPNRPTEVWTAGEPDSNRYWFPTYDWPDEKATTKTVTTVPEGQTVVSNGRLISVAHDRAHRRATFTWVERVPHSTYLTAIYAGYFDRVATRADSVPIEYYAARGAGRAAADNWRMTPDVLRFFAQFNGAAFPWEKYAEVGIQSDPFGSLENVSATMLGGKRHDRRAELDYFAAGTVAHELSHHWWGDYETCADWGELWLNEGFATYSEALYRQHARGEDAFAMDMHDIAGVALDQDAQYRRPIVTERYASPMEMFDGTTYQKGAVVLHMLNVMLGDDLYRKGQTAFLSEYAAMPADTAQWEAAFERATGRDLSWFVKEWLYSAGYPEFDVRWRFDPATGFTHVHVEQTQRTAWSTPAVFTMPIPVEVLYANGPRMEAKLTVNARTQDFTLPYYSLYSLNPQAGTPTPDPAAFRAAARPASVIFDAAGSVFAAVDDHASTEELRYRMEHATALVDRLDAFEEIPQTTRSLPWLAQFLQREHDPDERAEALGGLRLATPGARDLLIHYLDAGPPAMRAAAAQALSGARADAATLAVLFRHATYDESYGTMSASIDTLGRLREKSARALLLRAAADRSGNGVVAGAALRALARIAGRTAVPMLERDARYGASEDSRPDAVAALSWAGRDDPAAAAYVASLMHDKDLAVRYAAASALGRMGVPAAIGVLQNDLATSPDLPFYRTIVRRSIAALKAETRRNPTNRAP